MTQKSLVPSLLSLLSLLFVFSCGDVGGDVQLNATVRMDGLLRDEVRQVHVYAMAPRRKDNVVLTCSSLLATTSPASLTPDSPNVDVLDKAIVDFAVSGRDITLKKVESGEDRVVLVLVYDVGGALIGNGCAEGINVESGSTADVTIVVYRI